MDFDFSDDQEQLRDAVRRFVEKAYDFERRKQIVQAGGFSPEAFAELAGLGLCGLYVPEADGGLGFGPVDGMVVMEELGRGLVLEPLTQSLIAGAVLAGYASADVKAEWLPHIASGEALVSLAYQERKARYHIDVCEAKAAAVGQTYRLTATKNIVPAGQHAQAFLVPALIGEHGQHPSPADGPMAMFLVRRDAPGVQVRGYGTQDGGCAADVVLTDAAATLVTLDGQAALQHALDIGIAAACAEAVGVMDQALAVTVDYMNTRKQFGVAIASFQALRHRVADMKMALELARSMSMYASLKLNAPAAERSAAASRAKYQVGQSMRAVGQGAVQLHGGIGVTDEYIVSHYFKKLTQLELTFGDSLHHLGQVSARMQDTAGVFA
jgi:alkylation response protein AidB-like acyl-CoA dehydrogenase